MIRGEILFPLSSTLRLFLYPFNFPNPATAGSMVLGIEVQGSLNDAFAQVCLKVAGKLIQFQFQFLDLCLEMRV